MKTIEVSDETYAKFEQFRGGRFKKRMRKTKDTLKNVEELKEMDVWKKDTDEEVFNQLMFMASEAYFQRSNLN